MALRFVDSFDHYVTADLLTKWQQSGGSVSNPIISATNGRNSTASLRLPSAGSNAFGWVTKTLDSQATWIVGFAFRTGAIGNANIDIVSFRDAGTLQCAMYLGTDGTLRIVRTGTLLASSTFAISVNQFYYIELKLTIHNTAGSAVIRVNGSEVLNITGQNTRGGTTNNSANEITIGDRIATFNGTNGPIDFDDMYFCDTSSSINNDFLGDIRVQAVLPTGAGTTTNFTPSTGSNFQNVDDANPNGDTDYNASNNIGDIDTYAMGDVTPTTGTVKGIANQMYIRKDDGGTRTIAAAIRTNANNYFGSNQNIRDSYGYFTEIWETNPNTSGGFTISEINNIEAGVKITG